MSCESIYLGRSNLFEKLDVVRVPITSHVICNPILVTTYKLTLIFEINLGSGTAFSEKPCLLHNLTLFSFYLSFT